MLVPPLQPLRRRPAGEAVVRSWRRRATRDHLR